MRLKIDESDRKAYDAAFVAVVEYGSVRRALSHHGQQKSSEKEERERNCKRRSRQRLAGILAAAQEP